MELIHYLAQAEGSSVGGENQHGWRIFFEDAPSVHCRVKIENGLVIAAMQKLEEGAKIITVRIEIEKNPDLSEQRRIIHKHVLSIEKGTDIATFLEATPKGTA